MASGPAFLGRTSSSVLGGCVAKLGRRDGLSWSDLVGFCWFVGFFFHLQEHIFEMIRLIVFFWKGGTKEW